MSLSRLLCLVVVLLCELCVVLGQLSSDPNGTLVLQFDAQSQTVPSLPPFTAYFTGNVTAPSSNNATLYSLLVPNSEGSGLSGPGPLSLETYATIPPLAPGESFSGLLLTVIYPPYNGVDQQLLHSNNQWGDRCQLLYASHVVHQQSTASAVFEGEFDLTVVPSVALQDTLVLQLDDGYFVTAYTLSPPYLLNITGTISAPANNTRTLYSFGSLDNDPGRFVLATPAAIFTAIPALAPGASYSGLLATVDLSLFLNSTYFGSYVALFGLEDSVDSVDGSVSEYIELIVNAASAVSNTLVVQLEQPTLSVASAAPYTVSFFGSVTALVSNNETLYSLLLSNAGSNIVIVPDITYTFATIPPLAPGQSYSGALVNITYPPYNLGNDVNTYSVLFVVQYSATLQDLPRRGQQGPERQLSLTVLPSATVTPRNVLTLQFDNQSQTVPSLPPFVAYYYGTVTAPATNNETLYSVLFNNEVPIFQPNPNIDATFIPIPPLAPGESYVGLLINVIYPPYNTSNEVNEYGQLIVLAYAATPQDVPHRGQQSPELEFGLTVLPAPTSVLGDPMFVGLLGQRFQVHGVDGAVYNLISDRLVQVNSRFTFLSRGDCPVDPATGLPLFTCWTHPGSYMSELAVRSSGGQAIVIKSGPAARGFLSVAVVSASGSTSTRELSVGESAVLLVVDGLDTYNCTVTFTSLRTIAIERAGLYSLAVENSDRFLNLLRLDVSSTRELRESVQSHGLIGQTWRADQKGTEVRAVEGAVDDYAEGSGDMLGCDFVYDRFGCK